MKKFSLVLTSLLLTLASVEVQADQLPPGYCQVGCRGASSVPAFNFAQKAAQAGDPNGGPLKPTTKIPGDEGQAPNQTISTGVLLGNLKKTEEWSSSQCGKSLNDDSWSSVVVVAPCGGTAMLDRKAGIIKEQHKQQGQTPPSKKVADDLYKQADSAVAQKNLDEQMYCRFILNGQNANSVINSNSCKPYEMTLGSTSTVAVGMTAKSCRSLYVPAFVPEFSQTVGSGVIGCRKGIPNGAKTGTSEEANFGAWILGFSLPLLKMDSIQIAPIRQNVTHASNNYFMGSSLCPKNVTASEVSYDESCPAYKLHEGVSATFAVGPIPITVEAGGEGQISVTQNARVTPMWANGRATPGVNVSGYASAYVDFAIVKGGVEAGLTIINDTLDVYGFSASAFLPKNGNLEQGFYYTYQTSGYDTVNTLSGFINAFAKVPVPKFIGWKWKKFTYNIFSWAGLTTKGYVFNEAQGPLSLKTVK